MQQVTAVVRESFTLANPDFPGKQFQRCYGPLTTEWTAAVFGFKEAASPPISI
jgi:hypothetical protein